MISKIKQKILEHQNESPNREVCGFIFIGDENELDCCAAKNISIADSLFIIDSKEYFEKKISHKLCGVYHTHLESNPEPSEFDKISSEHVCLPFLIYSVAKDEFSLFKPDFLDCSIEGVTMLEGAI